MKTVVIVSVVIATIFAACAAASSRIPLRDVKVLTLRDGQYTTGRRSSPIPQLTFTGWGHSQYKPSVVQCYNKGWDGRDVQWKCEADLDSRVKFGKVEVVCEGYDYPDDPFILAGSCGLEYSLELTEKGRQEQGWGNWWNSNTQTKAHPASHSRVSLRSVLFWVIVVIIIFVICKNCCTGDPARPDEDPPRSSWGGGGYGGDGGGGGGYGGGGGGQQPPPYGFRDEPPPSYDDCSSARHRESERGTAADGGSGAGGGGFWTGFGTGGLLGYMMGNTRNRDRSYYQGPSTSYWGSGNRGFGFNGGRESSSWFSGSSGGSSSSGGEGSSSRTASGYGGTRRR